MGCDPGGGTPTLQYVPADCGYYSAAAPLFKEECCALPVSSGAAGLSVALQWLPAGLRDRRDAGPRPLALPSLADSTSREWPHLSQNVSVAGEQMGELGSAD